MPRKPISFELDFMIKDIFPRFTVKQFDDVSFNIKPKNQGLDYDITGTTGKIFVGVNNDMFMQTDGITISSNNINVLLDKNMLQKNGRAYAEIELTDSAGTITSSSFIFDIDPKIGEGGQIPGEYEGFVEKYERLISEFKSQVNSCVNNANILVNKTINNCNTNVDNKLNTVDGLINIKISDFEKRFNRLTVSQQQSTEVIDAREDFKGNVYDSLKERIDYTDKILRESTVSTVETESDFTTVEATSNGYFEDVKLEGKTLVNLAKTLNLTHYTTNNGGSFINNEFNSVIDGSFSGFVQEDVSMYKPNTTYTAIVNVKSNTTSTRIFSLNKLGSKLSVLSNSVLIAEPQQTGIYVFKFVTRESIDDSQKGFNVICNGAYTGQYTVKDVIILEGDHTQNPPSYFEGLKSAGQSATTSEDATDEIVVESVNENLISIEDIATPTNYISSNANYYIQPLFIGKGNTCYMNVELNGISTDSNVVFLLSNQRVTPYNSYKKIVYPNNTTLVISDSIKADDDGYVYLACHLLTNLEKATSFINKISLSCKDNKYTPHQSDKKRLLYYNNETQTWEKPILRQWDSIEKHSDGKYYYHQRSGEVIYDGSDDEAWWDTSVYGSVNVNTIEFRCSAKSILYDKSKITIICDKLNFVKNMWNIDVEGVCCLENNNIDIRISKSKLSTQDVAGFKQWLQANNVTVVYQLAQEKVYECTNIDLITYANETNYIVECGAIVPRTTLKVHNNISNVVSLLQKKVSLLESNVTRYMITQNRLMLASRYNADTVSFKVDVASYNNSFEYDNDLYELILNNILVGKDNYDREYIENLIIFYWMDFVISDEMYFTLFEIIEEQHNPKIEEETPLI